MREEDESEVRRIQAAIAPKLLAQVIEELCDHISVDKDAWFTAFSSRYLAPMAAMSDHGRYVELSRLAAEHLIQETQQAMHPNIRPR